MAHLESTPALESFAAIQEEPVPSPSSSLLTTTARLGIAVQLLPLYSRLPAKMVGGEREGRREEEVGGGRGRSDITRALPDEPNRIEIL